MRLADLVGRWTRCQVESGRFNVAKAVQSAVGVAFDVNDLVWSWSTPIDASVTLGPNGEPTLWRRPASKGLIPDAYYIEVLAEGPDGLIYELGERRWTQRAGRDTNHIPRPRWARLKAG